MMKKKLYVLVLVVCLALGLTACGGKEAAKADLKDETVMVYCGAGMKEPFQKIADAFKEETGCTVNVSFANAAQIQTQISESKEGDYFIAGSVEEVAPIKDYVTNSVELVKHIPVIGVATGNPKGITGVADLGKEGITTVIGDPESTPVGKIAKKAFKDFGVSDSVTLVATTTTAPQLATVITAGEADATIIWKENAKADGVEVLSTADMDAYVKTIPAARLNFNTENKGADAFGDYLTSDAADAIWTAAGYELAQ